MENNYPRGKLNENDEGELCMAVGIRDKTIIIDFGKPVAWIGLSALDARSFIKLLSSKVTEIEKT